jgi:hypothetical protein
MSQSVLPQRRAQLSLCAALASVCGIFPAGPTYAEEAPAPAQPQSHAVHEIVVGGQKPLKPRRQVRRLPPSAQPVQSASTSANASANGPWLQQVPQAGKTGTSIGDLRQSVVEVPRASSPSRAAQVCATLSAT